MASLKQQLSDLRKKYDILLQQCRHYQHLSTHDPQLHIFNRVAWIEKATAQCEKTRQKGQKSTVLFLDCDKFGSINKQYGHAAGDDIIKQILDKVQSVLRKGATVGRYGGDEILVYIPNAGSVAMSACAGRIVEAVRSLTLGDRNITVSVGGASGDGTLDRLVNEAEKHMRTAKGQGGDRYSV